MGEEERLGQTVTAGSMEVKYYISDSAHNLQRINMYHNYTVKIFVNEKKIPLDIDDLAKKINYYFLKRQPSIQMLDLKRCVISFSVVHYQTGADVIAWIQESGYEAYWEYDKIAEWNRPWYD